ICLFFFFSSRRRHTRFSRDWSSDVCSSDRVSPREDMLRLLQSMGFEQIFNIVPESTPTDAELQELPPQTLSEEQVRSRVLEAHRLLMDLNDHNRNAFIDLVTCLEQADESDDC